MIKSEQTMLFANWLYNEANIWLERKKHRFDKYKKDLSNRGSSSYRGVVWDRNKWRSSIFDKGKRIHLERYDDEMEAAKAHDVAIIQYDKPRYKLNFSTEGR